ncbi:MAG: hypoxanthine phosphoribosyltransferase [Desulfovibrio sp.]|nr:hypoxanthine phosphoribosyltransferase [Desulfovibrio sp.]
MAGAPVESHPGAGKLVSVFSPEEIAVCVRAMATRIDACYGEEPLVAVCVLKGACIFFSDLVRCLQNRNLELDFLRIASYGTATVSSGAVLLSKDVDTDIRDKHVLVVEDIVDSGRSMRFVLDELAARGPRSLRIAALVNKTGRREREVAVDFSGFSLDTGFLVGYGLDYAERYRALPGIYELVPE